MKGFLDGKSILGLASCSCKGSLDCLGNGKTFSWDAYAVLSLEGNGAPFEFSRECRLSSASRKEGARIRNLVRGDLDGSLELIGLCFGSKRKSGLGCESPKEHN